MLTLGLLVGCQDFTSTSSSTNDATVKPHGIIQMKTKVQDNQLNATLRDLQNQGMTNIDVKTETAGGSGGSWVVYDIMYEEPTKGN